ncbi:MAG: FkbM family methyltransferase [Alphaproteobacteria bacterium]
MARAVLQTLRFITGHPMTRRHKVKAVGRFAAWQIASRIFPAQYKVRWIDDTAFLVQSGDTGLTGNLYVGLMESPDMPFVLCRHKARDLFIDVGANLGAYTLLAAGAVGSPCLSIEPVPSTFRRLTENIRVNALEALVTLENRGCADEAATLTFTAGSDTTNHVATAEEQARLPADALVSVAVDRLDALVEPWRTQQSSGGDLFLKIDVEGFEWPALNGADSLLSDPALKTILVEINGSGARYGRKDSDLHALITSRGFTPIAFDPQSKRVAALADYQRSGGNTLYVRDLREAQARIDEPRAPFTIHPLGDRY